MVTLVFRCVHLQKVYKTQVYMPTHRPLHTLRALRTFLRKTQKEFAPYLAIPFDTLKSLETGRRGLTPQMADQIARRTGVNEKWLRENRGGTILDETGQPYSLSRFQKVQQFNFDRPEDSPFFLRLERMEFAQFYFLLCVIAEDYGQDLHGRITFKKRLERFIRAEEGRRPELHRKLEDFRIEWRKRNMGRLRVVSWLFPRDPEIFDVLIDDLRANKRALELHLRALDEARARRSPARPSPESAHRASGRKSS